MEELVLASYIKIMQEGFSENNKQESATKLLLDSVLKQKTACCATDLDSKKISNIANRKISVPDDIGLASSKIEVIKGVREYFSSEIMKELNPNTKYDTLNKLYQLVLNDPIIAELKVNELVELYKCQEFERFLTDTFLYVLGRENREELNPKWKAQTRILYRSSLYGDEDAKRLINDSHVRVLLVNGNVESNQIYRFEGDFSFESIFDDDGDRVVCGHCSTDKYDIVGETSVKNWISNSYKNNATKTKSVFCKVWIKVLETTGRNCRVQFLIIGDEV